jgi:hypothetical protein
MLHNSEIWKLYISGNFILKQITTLYSFQFKSLAGCLYRWKTLKETRPSCVVPTTCLKSHHVPKHMSEFILFLLCDYKLPEYRM